MMFELFLEAEFQIVNNTLVCYNPLITDVCNFILGISIDYRPSKQHTFAHIQKSIINKKKNKKSCPYRK